jgi:uncharacterized protein GlcG (DUF336 family)
MLKGLTIAGAMLALSSSAHADMGFVMWHDLSLDMAKTIAEATLTECRNKGFHTAAVVVDRSGQVLVSLRDERATPQMAEMARRKAYTAKMFRVSTADWVKRMQTDPSLAPQRDLPDVLALAGGVPIKMGDETIGAVASSGSSQPQDDACAHAGVAKVANLLK